MFEIREVELGRTDDILFGTVWFFNSPLCSYKIEKDRDNPNYRLLIIKTPFEIFTFMSLAESIEKINEHWQGILKEFLREV